MISDLHIHTVRDFPGSPMAKTPYLHCRALGSIPSQGTKIPHAELCGQKKNNLKRFFLSLY